MRNIESESSVANFDKLNTLLNLFVEADQTSKILLLKIIEKK